MTKAADPTIKAAKAKDVKTVLERTTTPAAVSKEAEAKLTRELPPIKESFIEAQAEKFGTTVERVTEIAEAVAGSMPAPLVLEKREFSVEADVQEYFREIFQKEIRKRDTCPYMMEQIHIAPTGKQSTFNGRCGEKLETVQQAWVHHALHIMYDSGDPRTQRAMLMDIRELLWPTQEKSVRAALGPDERAEYSGALERHRARARARN